MEHEIKYSLSAVASRNLLGLLRGFCWEDTSYPASIVSSIYFDTRNWLFLREKLNSDFLKTKIRLRWYSDMNTRKPGEVSFLEGKLRFGSKRQKKRRQASFTGECLSNVKLCDKRLLEVNEQLYSMGIILNKELIPVFQINYCRNRFIDPITNMRISLDYNIHVSKINSAFIPYAIPGKVNKAVFEIKGNLEHISESILKYMGLGLRRESFSKYSICYNQIMPNFVK